MSKSVAFVALSVIAAAPALAIEPQKTSALPVATTAVAAAPVSAPPAEVAAAPVATPVMVELALPANADVLLRMDQELNSKTAKVGDRFNMTVVNDVVHNGYVVIPAGTRAMGEVTFHTKKGSFGKSGKMEIEIKYVELGGTRIPVTGKYRQEGEGGTTATVLTAVAVGVFSAFVTGKSAIIPQGRELLAQTDTAVPYNPTTAPKPAAVPAPPAAAPAATPAVAPATPTN